MANMIKCDKCGEIVESYKARRVQIKRGNFIDVGFDICENCYKEIVKGLNVKEG